MSSGENKTVKLKKSVSTVLYGLRVENQLTQINLSEISGVGRSYLSHLENGDSMPTIEIIFFLASAFDMKPSELLELIDQEFSKKKPTKRN